MFIRTLIIFITITTAYSSSNPSQNISFTLGQNIVVNSDMSLPSIYPLTWNQYFYYSNGWSTKNLYLQFVIPHLMQQIIVLSVCKPYIGINSNIQFISLDSIILNEYVYQEYNLQSNVEFKLSLDWSSQGYLQASCGFSIIWNGVSQFQIYDGSCTLKSITLYVISQSGINQLAFQSLGIPDSVGIMIRNVQLQQLIYSAINISNTSIMTNSTNSSNNSTQIINPANITNTTSVANSTQIATNNSFILRNITHTEQTQANQDYIKLVASALNSPLIYFYKVSSLQKTLKSFFGFVIEFNHLILYSYHDMNYTVNTLYIFAMITDCEDMKGQIIDNYIYKFIGLSQSQILQGFEDKNNYYSQVSWLRSSSRSNSFLLSITDFVFYKGPLAIGFLVVGFGLFKLTFNYKISLLFRRYSFLLGYYICFILQGQVELYTFYYLSQLLLFFSQSLLQKWLNLCILLFYFFIFISSVGGPLLFFIWYHSKAKWLYENCSNRNISITIQFVLINNGIFNIVLGAFHRLLIFSPNSQLICLISAQLLMICIQVIYFCKKIFENRLLAISLILMGLARTIFVITFFIDEKFSNIPVEMNQIHYYYFYIFVGTWLFSVFISCLQYLSLFYKIIKYTIVNWIAQNKIKPSQEGAQSTTNHQNTSTQINRQIIENHDESHMNNNKKKVKNFIQQFISKKKKGVSAMLKKTAKMKIRIKK